METDFRSSSRLERVLRSGRFAVTAELNPPDSADSEDVYQAALMLSTVCDGINAVDASGANCHMSSVSICALLTRAGYDPVYQVSCRDRNRIAIQGDLLGAAANPFVPPYEWRPIRLAKKINAGADFFQTQFCFDVPRLRTFMERVRDMGLHEKAFILVGVGPLRSERAAEFMRTKVPGVIIPDVIVEPLRKTPKRHKRAEGKRICVEIIQQVREIEGVAGVHVMAYRHEELVAEIVDEAKLLPRPGRRDIVRPRNQRSSNRIRGN